MGFEYLLSTSQAYYEQVRPFILMRDDHKCVICGNKAKIVHHIDGNSLNSNFTNLVSVCKNHHSHTKEMNLVFQRAVQERKEKMQQLLRKMSVWRHR